MDDSLLVRLRKYRPTEGRDSLEDFVTEAFCWLLGNYSDFAFCFLDHINQSLTEADRFDLPNSEDVDWQTQFHIGGKRVDMAALWDGDSLLFEHKVWAELHDNQIQNYIDGARDHLGLPRARIIVISATTAQHSKKASLCLCWEQVADLIDKYKAKIRDEIEIFHLNEFYALLKHEGIAHSDPIPVPAVHFYPVAKSFPDYLKDALAPLQRRDWAVESDYQCSFHNVRWGRLGLELTRKSGDMDWAPGIFIGCVLFGKDHGIEHRLDVVKFQIIVCFHLNLHPYYPDMKAFENLRGDLGNRAKGTPWEFYDHLAETQNPNRYHTLYLEQPLKNLITGSRSLREQQDVLFEAASEGLRLLQASGDFKRLMRECDEKAE